jgi:hypothetical protein
MKAFEIKEFKYNSAELIEVYLNNNNEWAKYGKDEKLTLHTQYISLEHPVILKHIEQIKNYKYVVENVKFFKTLKNAGVGPHKDKRNVAINIPVLVDENSCIVFYEAKDEIDPVLSLKEGKRLTTAKYFKIEQAQSIEKFKSKNVFCIDTSQIHGVLNESNNDRVILSISFKEQYNDFNIIKKMYETGQLL